MANAEIERVGPDEIPLLVEMYNTIFRPPQNEDFFLRRSRGRHNALMLVAELDQKPVGFSCGYELRPTTYYSWLCGVLPDARRLGVASQLMDAEHAWAREQGYEMLRFESTNNARPMIHFAIRSGFEIVGVRWDHRAGTNLIIFEKILHEPD